MTPSCVAVAASERLRSKKRWPELLCVPNAPFLSEDRWPDAALASIVGRRGPWHAKVRPQLAPLPVQLPARGRSFLVVGHDGLVEEPMPYRA